MGIRRERLSFLRIRDGGLFSYEALRSRLCDSRFDGVGYKNLLSPVIRLRRLSDNELLALIARMTELHAQYYSWAPPVGRDDMEFFLRRCLERAGADSLLTPRELLRDYMAVLGILLQNDGASFESVVGKAEQEQAALGASSVQTNDHRACPVDRIIK